MRLNFDVATVDILSYVISLDVFIYVNATRKDISPCLGCNLTKIPKITPINLILYDFWQRRLARK